ncbi:MAG TPA: hypothetical protein VLF20_01550 [Patescibacteria group bacterium]|nr:hypothetical protein [Patescibacteria group bacterium]
MYVEKNAKYSGYQEDGRLKELFESSYGRDIVVVTTPPEEVKTETKRITVSEDGKIVTEAFRVTHSGMNSPFRRVRLDGVGFMDSNDRPFHAHIAYWSDRAREADKHSERYETLASGSTVGEGGAGFLLLASTAIYALNDRPGWALIGMGLTGLATLGFDRLRRTFRNKVRSGRRYQENVQIANATIGRSDIASKPKR